MEPVLIATDSSMTDVCAVTSFELDMAVGYDLQDFTATFSRIDGVGGGSLLYIDGTDYGGIVDDVITDTESGLVRYHGRTWDGILAAKVILPPEGQAYRTVSGEANAVLASLVTLLDISDVFEASTENSGISVDFQFDRFTDAYSGLLKMLASVGSKLKMRRVAGKTILSAEVARVISDEADSDLVDFELTATNRTVNHLVCLGMGELEERTVIHLFADADGNVSQTQTLFGRDEVTEVYDYSNAEEDELLKDGTEVLKDYQTKGAVEITSVDAGEWDIGDTLVARDNRSGTVISAPITGKTVNVNNTTNWHLHVAYEVGEASRSASGISGNAEVSYVFGVKGDAEADYRSGNVNLTPANIGAVESDGGGITDAAAFCDALGIGTVVSTDISTNVSVANSTYKSIGSITLTRGVWMITGACAFASNATGRRFLALYTSDAEPTGAWLRANAVSQAAISGANTRMQSTMITTVTASSYTIYLIAWQNSGSALNATGYIRAVKVSS